MRKAIVLLLLPFLSCGHDKEEDPKLIDTIPPHIVIRTQDNVQHVQSINVSQEDQQ